MSKSWWKAAGVRAVKTMCQTAVGVIAASAAADVMSVNWGLVVSSSVLAGIVSMLTSLQGLPEVEDGI